MLLLPLLVSLAWAEPCQAIDVNAGAMRVRDLLFASDAPGALAEGVSDERALPCLTTMPTTRDLALLFQATGAAALLTGDHGKAEELLGTAVRVAEAIPFDATLGPDAAALYRTVSDARTNSRRLTVIARGDVDLDGWPLRDGDQREIAVGVHLVQYIGPTDLVTSWAVLDGVGTVKIGPPPPPPRHDGKRASMVITGISLTGVGIGCFLLSGAVANDWITDEAASQGGAALSQDDRVRRATELDALQIAGGIGVGLGAVVTAGAVWMPTLGISGAW